MISEVYGGGNAGGPVGRDFVELFNRGGLPVDLTGWSVQYAAAGSGTWQVTPLAGSIAPGQYFLVGEADGGTGSALPTPDAAGSIDLGEFAGKVALVRTTIPLTDPDPDLFAVIDLVGYGAADFFEGTAPAPALNPTVSGQRLDGGFVDSDSNTDDFLPGTPTPQNSSTFHPAHANVAPTIDAPAYQITPADTALVFSDADDNPIWVDDVDAANFPVEVTLAVPSGTLSLDEVSGTTLTITGTLVGVNVALDGLTFTPAAGFTGNVPLTVRVNDLGSSGSGGFQITQAEVLISVGRAVLVQAADAVAFEEGQDPAQFTIIRTGDTSSSLVVGYTVSGTATFGTGPGGDYALLSASGSPLPSSGSITIPAGESEVTITVQPIDDGVAEDEETVQFTLQAGAGYVVAAGGQAETKVNDQSFGLDKTKEANANNHKEAHGLATGAGVRVGVIELSKGGKGIDEKKAHLGNRLKLNQDFTGLRPRDVVTPDRPNPEGTAIAQDKSDKDHAALVASVIGSQHERFTGVAKGAEIYGAFMQSVDAFKVAMDYLYSRQQVFLFNMSFGADFALEGRDFLDWFVAARDSLFLLCDFDIAVGCGSG